MHVIKGDKVYALVKRYFRGSFKSHKIIEATVLNVGTKYIYLDYDFELGKGKPRFCKKSGIDRESGYEIKRRIFETKEKAEIFVAECKQDAWYRKFRYSMANGKFSIEQYKQAAEIFGITEPVGF